MKPAGTSSFLLLRAAWIAPMDRPILRDGAVVVSGGRIAAAGDAADLERQYPDAARRDLGPVLLLPGLINAHVHLELSGQWVGEPPKSFVDWLLGVMAGGGPPRHASAQTEESRWSGAMGCGTPLPVGSVQPKPRGGEYTTPWHPHISPASNPTVLQPMAEADARLAAATQSGIDRCLRFGVTTVGDISRNPAIVRTVLASNPLRAVSFGEVTAMGGRRHLLEPRIAAAMTAPPGDNMSANSPDRPCVAAAISPHAPYSIELPGYVRCLEVARRAGAAITTHLAESADEAVFLAEHNGPFRRLWETIGGWDDAIPRFAGGPIQFARAIGLLDYSRALLAHVNYADDDELALLAAGRASVVFCPRTHAYFGHPPHRWRRMLELGINVCVGTDSTASSPDLNLVDDLRLLHRQSPGVPAQTLWEMVTIRAAAALGLGAEVGSITPGKAADLVAFDVATDEPMREVLEAEVKPAWVRTALQLADLGV